MKQIDTGLAPQEEVTQRNRNKANTNDSETKTSKSTTAIFKDNILTLFNLLELVDWCLSSGSWRSFQFILSGNHFDQP